jgi:hypothetical protein
MVDCLQLGYSSLLIKGKWKLIKSVKFNLENNFLMELYLSNKQSKFKNPKTAPIQNSGFFYSYVI